MGFDSLSFLSYLTSTAWNETTEEKEGLTAMSEARSLFLDYTQDSTVQGLGYVFLPNQTIIGRIFWAITVVFMFSLGVYWCQQAYLDWSDYPVLTTVTTTSFSINEVISNEAICILKLIINYFEFANFKVRRKLAY